ncbi:MAG: acyltransferase family protein [Dysgonomonas sp.]|nr:acyltransferase family protein [Dysgonomonas sp.]
MRGEKSLESIKFVLIFLVVYGHSVQHDMKEDSFKMFLFCSFAIFVIPLFIMISGFQSKKLNWKKYKRTSISLLITYFFFQTIYYLPSMTEAVLGFTLVPNIMGEFSLFDFLFIPTGSLWFIWGLLVWRTFIYFIIKYKINFTISMSVSLAISFALGFIRIEIPSSRILVFFPFFLLGYFCSNEIYQKIKTSKLIYSLPALLLIPIAVLLHNDSKQFFFIVFGETPYSSYASMLSGLSYRIIFYPITVICSLAVLRILPDYFYKWGNKTLGILLIHPLLVYPIYHLIIRIYNLEPNLIVDLIAATIITIICILLQKVKMMQYIIYPAFLLQNRKLTSPITTKDSL